MFNHAVKRFIFSYRCWRRNNYRSIGGKKTKVKQTQLVMSESEIVPESKCNYSTAHKSNMNNMHSHNNAKLNIELNKDYCLTVLWRKYF